MKKFTIAPVLLVAMVACATLSCQKLPEPAQLNAGLKLTTASFNDAIPLEYGQLVSVTALPESPYNAVMWFRRADESIVAVRVNVSRGALGSAIIEIPRR